MLSAAPRDASWYNHPDVYSFKVVHADNGDAFAACNSRMLLTDSPRWNDSREVPEDSRCRRRACTAAFAAADTEPSDAESSDV